jgi:hypothetical protein
MVPAGSYTISVNRLNKKSPGGGNNREAMYLKKIEVRILAWTSPRGRRFCS